ncbi:unnamed protein product [Owenia fusiformis]|uniref:Uncharacterized protein n=1 Tax=Owenia fusiformis TaxID=6347 RepID=A0A8S4P750_OWEFU|nr:unnamed protein product [Owenia fusiformis]
MAIASKRIRLDTDAVLEKTVTCQKCMKYMDDPRMLPCLHTFCRRCIQKTMDKYDNSFPCHICKKVCRIPTNDEAAGIKVNSFAHSILNILKDKNNEWNCDVCFDGGETIKAKSFCCECNEKHCTYCGHTHEYSHSTSTHTVLKLTGNKSCDTKTMINMLSQQALCCRKHPSEPLEYHCEELKKLICRVCALHHKGHHHSNIKQTADGNIDTLSAAIDLGKERLREDEVNINKIHKHIEAIEQQIKNSRAKLDAEKCCIQRKVNTYFNNLQSELISVGNSVIKQTESNLAVFKLDQKVIDDTVMQLEVLKEHGHDTDIANMIPEINTKKQDWSTPVIIDVKPVVNLTIKSSEINDDNVFFAKLREDNTSFHQSNYIRHSVDMEEDKPVRLERSLQPRAISHKALVHSSSKQKNNEHKIVHQFSDLRVSKDDKIITLDADKIRIYDETSKNPKVISLFHSSGVSLTTTEENNLIVCYENARCTALHVYTNDGTYKGQIKIPSIKDPRDIAINHHNKLIILTGNEEINVCDYTGPHARIRSFDIDVSACKIPNECTMAINSKDVLILSGQGYVEGIQIVDGRKRKTVFKFSPRGCKGDILKVCTDSRDNIILHNVDQETIKLYTPDCEFIKDLLTPSTCECQVIDIAVNNDDEVVVGAKHKGSDTKTCIFTIR